GEPAMRAGMASARHDGEPFDGEALPAYLLRQREEDMEWDVERAGGKLPFDIAPLGPHRADIDARRLFADGAHEPGENGGLQGLAHANDEALGRARGVEPVGFPERDFEPLEGLAD